jgi:hypothetical protein
MDIFLSLLFRCAAFFGYLSSLHRLVEVQDNFYMGLGSYVLSTMLIAALTLFVSGTWACALAAGFAFFLTPVFLFLLFAISWKD